MMKDYCIMLAKASEKDEILSFYRQMLYGPAGWNENYPNEVDIDYDLSREALFVMKNPKQEIVATISIDLDPNVEELDCWSKELMPGAELSRLGVREDERGKGIAGMMMKHCFEILRAQGKKSVHILVSKVHEVAIRSYSRLGFVKVSETHMYDKDYICMEIKL